jgi:hypothetical protein
MDNSSIPNTWYSKMKLMKQDWVSNLEHTITVYRYDIRCNVVAPQIRENVTQIHLNSWSYSLAGVFFRKWLAGVYAASVHAYYS